MTDRVKILIENSEGYNFIIEEINNKNRIYRGKTIGSHKRRSNNKEYIQPRVVLHSSFNDMIGRMYTEYRGKGTLILEGSFEEPGEFVLLWIPRKRQFLKAEASE